jgi:hypothetical protein
MSGTETYPLRVIELFGGSGRGAIRRMAKRTGIAERTIYEWSVRGRIPSTRHRELFWHAQRLGVPLKPEHFFDLPGESLAMAPAESAA